MADAPSTSRTSDSDTLYEECSKAALDCAEKFRKVFNQDEMLKLCEKAGLDKVFDTQTLMPLVQALSYSNLLISLKQKAGGNGLCWSLRPRDAARQMAKLPPEDKMVYIMIEEAHSNGIWVRNIKKRSNLTDQGLNKVVERLSKQRLIKGVRNIRAPAQKTYMLYHLAPSDEVTGGTFYDAGELDETLVEELGNLIVFYVRQASWIDEKRRKIKTEPGEAISIPDNDEEVAHATPSGETRGRKKRKLSHSTKDIEDSGPARKFHRHSHIHVQLSHPAGHRYPDTQDIYDFINSNNFIRAAKQGTLTVDEVQNLINVLVWDDKLERMNGGYRTVRGVERPDHAGKKVIETSSSQGNGLTQMPCGRCPVLHLCGKGGPINSSACVYFDQWLAMAVDRAGEEPKAKIEVEVLG